MNQYPFLSFVVPARNEENFIAECIESLMAQDYPKDKMEILVVNGASEDKTENIALEYSQKYSFVKVLQNPKKFTPISMNVGIKAAKGEIIMIIGGHSELESSYVKKGIMYMNKYNADVVGGVLDTLPAKNTRSARAIAITLTSFFGTGGSIFRTGTKEIREADATFNALYRKSIFEKVGWYNEALTRSQDIDLNLRIKAAGGKILIAPDMKTAYFPKSTFGEFFKHNIADGEWAILPLKSGAVLKPRHLAPLGLVSAIILPLFFSILYFPLALISIFVSAFYLALALLFSIIAAYHMQELSMFPFIFAGIIIRHFGYGWGSLVGIFKLFSRS